MHSKEIIKENLEWYREQYNLISHLLSTEKITDKKNLTAKNIIKVLWLSDTAVKNKINECKKKSIDSLDVIGQIEEIYLIKDIVPKHILDKYISSKDEKLKNYKLSLENLEKLKNKSYVGELIEALERELMSQWEQLFVNCIREYVEFLEWNFNTIKIDDIISAINWTKKTDIIPEQKIEILNMKYKERAELVELFERWSKEVVERKKEISRIKDEIAKLLKMQSDITAIIKVLRWSPFDYIVNEIDNEIKVILSLWNFDKKTLNDIKKTSSEQLIIKQLNQTENSYNELVKFLNSLKELINNRENTENIDNKYKSLCWEFSRLCNDYDIDKGEIEKEIEKIRDILGKIVLKRHRIQIELESDTKDGIENMKKEVKDIGVQIEELKDKKSEKEKQNKGRGKWKKEAYADLDDLVINSKTKKDKQAALDNFTEKDIVELHKALKKIDSEIRDEEAELLQWLDLNKVAYSDTRSKIIDLFGIEVEDINSLFNKDSTSGEITSWDGHGERLKDQDNKVWIFIKVLLEKWIFSTSDLQDPNKISIKQENSKSPYYYIYIYWDINKIFCINNHYGNATFVYYGTEFDKFEAWFSARKTKKKVKKLFNEGLGTYFNYKDTQSWKKTIEQILLMPEGSSWPIEWSETDSEKNIANAEEIREYFHNKEIKISSEIEYNQLKDEFKRETWKDLPEFKHIFAVLGWNPKCKDTWYLDALLKSPEAWQQYLENKKLGVYFTNKDKKIVDEFIVFLNKYPEYIEILLHTSQKDLESLSTRFNKHLEDNHIDTKWKTLSTSIRNIMWFLWLDIPLPGKYRKEQINILLSNQWNREKGVAEAKNIVEKYRKSNEWQEKIKNYEKILWCMVDYFHMLEKPFPKEGEYEDLLNHNEPFKNFIEENHKDCANLFKSFKYYLPTRTSIMNMLKLLWKLWDDDSVDLILKTRDT